MSIFNQLFYAEFIEYPKDGVAKFTNVKLKKRIGIFQEGTIFDTAIVNCGEGTISLYHEDKLIQSNNLMLVVGNKL